MMWTIVFCNFLWICSVWCATLKFEHERIGKDTASQRVKVRYITRRSVDGIRTLHLSAFGKDHVLQLKPSEIFTPDFEFLQASRAPDGNLEFTKIEVNQKKHSNSEGKLYTVNDGKGSVYITNDATLKVEGLISNELRIAPEEDDWFEDGSLAHYVHQIETHNYFQQADYLIPDPSDNSFQHISFAAENVPDEITVEVLVVFDHANSKRLEFNLDKIRKYVGIFWSQINYRYRDTANPKINVAVSGLLTFTNPEDEPFIFKHRYDGDRVDKECLGSFKNWLKDSFTSLPKHDAAILQLGLDAGRWLNGSWDYTYAGLAYVGTACSTSGTSSGFAEDRAPQFGGFMAAAHELGHVLNCPHDGTGAAKECPSGGGFIMSGGSKKTFSTCSLEIMQKFVLSDKRNCLKDTPIIGVPLIDVWPVLMVEDLNEQCQLMFKNKDYFFPGKINAGVCEKMWCGKKNSGVRYLLRGAYDGTPCGFNKVCLDKKCVDMPASSVDKQCQMGFGIQYKASAVESICQNVQCSDSQTGEEKSLGTPLPGTLCGTRNLQQEHLRADLPSERVKVRSINRRSVDGTRTLQLSAFGKDHVLQLKPIEVFTSDFEFLQVNRGPDGKTEFNKVEEDQANKKTSEGQLYTVNDGKGSLYITDDGTLQVEGLINDELRIVPSEDDLFEDGSLAHSVHQIQTPDYEQKQDFVIPDPSKNIFQDKISAADIVPAEVTVEVLVVFDYTSSKRLNFNLDQIRKYVGIFWSQIHYRYRDTSTPKINVVVSGLLTIKKPEDEPFIVQYRYDGDRVDKECLSSFADWLRDSSTLLPKHDVAILQLGLDAGVFNADGTWDEGIAGLAYVGTACSTSGVNSGFAEDRVPLFIGFNGAAHELAHILDAPHDGEDAATACPPGQGFIMSGGEKKTFSSCSKNIMRKFVSASDRKCLWDKPTIGVPLIDVWPVLMVEDLDEQCKSMFGSNDYFFPGQISEDFCDKMWCGKKKESYHITARGAYDGTPCAFNKVCLDQKCVNMPSPALDKQCQQRFGNQFKASKPQNVCQKVECANTQTGKKESLGRPTPGTPCGTKNVCLNGKCYAV